LVTGMTNAPATAWWSFPYRNPARLGTWDTEEAHERPVGSIRQWSPHTVLGIPAGDERGDRELFQSGGVGWARRAAGGWFAVVRWGWRRSHVLLDDRADSARHARGGES
jgi:hypothetical protein